MKWYFEINENRWVRVWWEAIWYWMIYLPTHCTVCHWKHMEPSKKDAAWLITAMQLQDSGWLMIIKMELLVCGRPCSDCRNRGTGYWECQEMEEEDGSEGSWSEYYIKTKVICGVRWDVYERNVDVKGLGSCSYPMFIEPKIIRVPFWFSALYNSLKKKLCWKKFRAWSLPFWLSKKRRSNWKVKSMGAVFEVAQCMEVRHDQWRRGMNWCWNWTGMRMVRWMCGTFLRQKKAAVWSWGIVWACIGNWYRSKETQVEVVCCSCEEKEDWVRKCMNREVGGARPRGKPKKT